MENVSTKPSPCIAPDNLFQDIYLLHLKSVDSIAEIDGAHGLHVSPIQDIVRHQSPAEINESATGGWPTFFPQD
eukprot:10114701-Karenia_brevis.AAC.1